MTDINFRGSVPILGGASVRTQDATPQDVLNAYISLGRHAYVKHLADTFNAVALGQEEFEVAKSGLIGAGIMEIRRAPQKPPDNGGEDVPTE